jgi:hypothetical protein
VSYADLADKLAAVGVKDNQRNIANKIARGSFTAVLFVQCMEVIGSLRTNNAGQMLPCKAARFLKYGRDG